MIINNALQIFNTKFSNMKYQNTYFMEYLSNPNLPNASLPQWIGKISNSTTIWYMSINHRGIHWLYLQINPNTYMITQHDSLPTATNTDYTNRIGELLTNHNNIEWTGQQVATPPQHNGYDCGIYVLAHIYHHIQGNQTFPTGHPSRPILRNMLITGLLPETLYLGSNSINSSAQATG